ncbi:hypothetical protein E2C01_067147 [Portunus trituberculatus]|uniref:Uncharacterized protein n=1 Tax=Portunus trituberculatus TaxID=210409 RepID=A0A5B7HRV5_PORTR|nr:hypothetical protein [Portunus trituberculatus]
MKKTETDTKENQVYLRKLGIRWPCLHLTTSSISQSDSHTLSPPLPVLSIPRDARRSLPRRQSAEPHTAAPPPCMTPHQSGSVLTLRRTREAALDRALCVLFTHPDKETLAHSRTATYERVSLVCTPHSQTSTQGRC